MNRDGLDAKKKQKMRYVKEIGVFFFLVFLVCIVEDVAALRAYAFAL